MAGPAREQPIDYLLVLRGFAACAVMLSHLPLLSRETAGLAGAVGFLLKPYGYVPVLVFFALSGYLITKGFVSERYVAASRAGVLEYLRNRALRILPLYWVSIVACAVLYIDRTRARPGAVLGLFTFTESYRNPLPIVFNQPYWSIPIEVFYYAAAPVLFLVLREAVRRIGWVGTGIAMLVLWRILAAWLFAPFELEGDHLRVSKTEWNVTAHHSFLFNLEAFLIGALANFSIASPFGAAVSARRGVRRAMKAAFILGLLGLLAVGANEIRPGVLAGQIGLFAAGGLVPAVAWTVFGLAVLQDTRRGRGPQRPGSAVRRRIAHALEWIGLLSYGIYLWNVPVRYGLARAGVGIEALGALGFTVASVAATFALSLLTFHVIERPALRLRTRPLELEREVRGDRAAGASSGSRSDD